MDDLGTQSVTRFNLDMHSIDMLQYNSAGLTTTKVASNKSTVIVVLLLLLLMSLFVGLLSLSAVVVLTTKVEALEARFDELLKQDKETVTETANEKTSSLAGKPAFVKEILEKMNRTATEDMDDTHAPVESHQKHRSSNQRTSRQTGGNDCSQCQTQPQHSFTHLSGANEGVHCSGPGSGQYRWISWHLPTEQLYQNVATDLLEVDFNTFITIRVPGYYYVYGQLTYHQVHDHPPDTFGFEIVKLSCPYEYSSVLLQSRTQQVQKDEITIGSTSSRGSSTDSAYVGGMFYFSYLDKIGLRKLVDFDLFETDLDVSNYFGAILMMRDHGAPISGQCSPGCCSPLSVCSTIG